MKFINVRIIFINDFKSQNMCIHVVLILINPPPLYLLNHLIDHKYRYNVHTGTDEYPVHPLHFSTQTGELMRTHFRVM